MRKQNIFKVILLKIFNFLLSESKLMICGGREIDRNVTPIHHFVIRFCINSAFNKHDRKGLLRYSNPVFPIRRPKFHYKSQQPNIIIPEYCSELYFYVQSVAIGYNRLMSRRTIASWLYPIICGTTVLYFLWQPFVVI